MTNSKTIETLTPMTAAVRSTIDPDADEGVTEAGAEGCSAKEKLRDTSTEFILAAKGSAINELLAKKAKVGNWMRRLVADDTKHSAALITAAFTVSDADTQVPDAKFEPDTVTTVLEWGLMTDG